MAAHAADSHEAKTGGKKHSRHPVQQKNNPLWFILGVSGGIICLCLFLLLPSNKSTSSPIKQVQSYSEVPSTPKTPAPVVEKNNPVTEDTPEETEEAKQSSRREPQEERDSRTKNPGTIALKLQIPQNVGKQQPAQPEDGSEKAVPGSEKQTPLEPPEKTAPTLEEIYETKLQEANKFGDTSRYLALAKWCKENGLNDKGNEQYQKILELEPNNLTARRALGHFRIGDAWVSKDDANRLGYYEHQGRWYRAQELQSKGLVFSGGKWIPRDAVNPDTPVDQAGPNEQAGTENGWLTEPSKAFQYAKNQNKLILANLYTESKKIAAEILEHPEFKKNCDRYILLKVSGEKEPDFAQRYQVRNYPALLLLDASGKKLHGVSGAAQIAAFAPMLQKLIQQADPTVDKEAAAAALKLLQPKESTPDKGQKASSQKKKAPDVLATTVLNGDGRNTLASHLGEVIMLEFFSST